MTARSETTTKWRRVDMRGCGPACVRRDLPVYNRMNGGRLQTGHEHPPGEVVPCGARVELQPGEGRRR